MSVFRNDAERPPQNVDQPMAIPPGGTPPGWMALVEGLHRDGDVVVLKHHWGAFTGTDLDLQLRRRGVKTIVLAGIATNMGVESTARSAWELGYDLVIVEDLCSARSAAQHAFAVENIFPQLSRRRGGGYRVRTRLTASSCGLVPASGAASEALVALDPGTGPG
ncbi:isochorismatase family protein [uncultured Sphingomonas sp.]|uniref:isochorismatase family protein n=1 Tax=uncultured Sphingomonas sp. TaxID=158754 RepID=UPI0035C9FD87